VIEPPDLWTRRMAARWGDRAPHVAVRGGVPVFVCEDVPPFGLGAFSGADVDPDDLPAHMGAGYEHLRAGGWDPAARRRDQERDGVVAEVVYPSLALQLYRVRDPALQVAAFAAYNDWLAEFCASAPDRLAGVGLVPLHDVAAAVRELARAHALGLRGALVWSAPPDDRPYHDGVYEPFWAAAAGLGMPLSLHVGTNAAPLAGTGGDMAVIYMTTHQAAQRSLAQLVFGGVLDRHPALRIVSVENDVGWLPHFLARLDHAGEKYRALGPHRLALRPSEYVRRQVAATFQEDRLGIRLRHDVGVGALLWGSDYPHTDSTWPRSREVIARDLADVPAAERDAITRGNAAALYGFPAGCTADDG
jgi:predicted TIM-barrel fold metal-dependent hydrolase